MGDLTDQTVRRRLAGHYSKLMEISTFFKANDSEDPEAQANWRNARAFSCSLEALTLQLLDQAAELSSARRPQSQITIDDIVKNVRAANAGLSDSAEAALRAAAGAGPAGNPQGGRGAVASSAKRTYSVTAEDVLALLGEKQPDRPWCIEAVRPWSAAELSAAADFCSSSFAADPPAHVAHRFFEELDLSITGDLATLLEWVEVFVAPETIEEWSADLAEEIAMWATDLHWFNTGRASVGPSTFPAVFEPALEDFARVLEFMADAPSGATTKLYLTAQLHGEIPGVAYAFRALYELDKLARKGNSDDFVVVGEIAEGDEERLRQVVVNLGRGLMALEGVDFEQAAREPAPDDGEPPLLDDAGTVEGDGPGEALPPFDSDGDDDLTTDLGQPLDLEDQLDLALDGKLPAEEDPEDPEDLEPEE